jgi:DNA-directed RNA polymerase specialized sigma24 family protein
VKTAITPSNLAKARQAVGALPDEERAVLLLVCSGGLSYRDAAKKLGISQDELKDRLLRARLALLKAMSVLPALSEKQEPDFFPVAEVACLPARKW